jgi:hypothetical protein
MCQDTRSPGKDYRPWLLVYEVGVVTSAVSLSMLLTGNVVSCVFGVHTSRFGWDNPAFTTSVPTNIIGTHICPFLIFYKKSGIKKHIRLLVKFKFSVSRVN